MEFQNSDDVNETLIVADEPGELFESSTETVAAVAKIPLAACDVRRKIEDLLEKKRYREEQGEDLEIES